jgi:hypothetical protein
MDPPSPKATARQARRGDQGQPKGWIPCYWLFPARCYRCYKAHEIRINIGSNAGPKVLQRCCRCYKTARNPSARMVDFWIDGVMES